MRPEHPLVRRRRALALLALGALLGPAPRPCSAQIPPTPYFEKGLKTAALQIGPVYPTSTNGFKGAVKGGPALNLQYLYYPSDWIGIGGELSYFAFGAKTIESNGVEISGKASAVNAGILVRANILRERTWTPYVLGGAGLHSFTFTLDSAGTTICSVLTGDCAQDSMSSKSQSLTVTAGAGIEAFVFRGMSLSFESRYHEFRLGGKEFDAHAESLSFLLGMRFWFGL